MAITFDSKEQLVKFLRDNEIIPTESRHNSKHNRQPQKRSKFMHRQVDIPVWLLFLFITFSAVGIGFTGYQVTLHYKEILVALGFIFALILVGWIPDKKRKRRRERQYED